MAPSFKQAPRVTITEDQPFPFTERDRIGSEFGLGKKCERGTAGDLVVIAGRLHSNGQARLVECESLTTSSFSR